MIPGLRYLPLFVALVPAVARAAELPIEDRPYRVRVTVSFEIAPEFTGPWQSAMLEQLETGIERCTNLIWDCDVSPEQGTLFSGLRSLTRLHTEILKRNADLSEYDKVYLLAVTTAGAGCHCLGREWDSSTQTLGSSEQVQVADCRELPTALLELLHRLFRPVVEVDQPRQGPASLRAQAGNLSNPAADWGGLTPGMLFEASYRILDQNLAVERIQTVPWTYLVAGSDREGGRVDCQIISGLRSPIPVRKTRLVPQALAIKHREGSTRLTLMTRSQARRPLGGVEVEIAPRLPGQAPPAASNSDSGTPTETGPTLITDRNGRVTLTADLATENRPVWLFVRSGQVLLARVPYLPGLRRQETIELPDDSLRLDVEGDIALLQARLVDTVARRAVLMAQARSRAKANRFDEAQAALTALASLPKSNRFLDDLNLIRINRTKAARASRDKSTEERIRKLCSESSELVTNYLDETKITDLRDEIRELRRVFDDNAALEAKAQAANPPAQAPPQEPPAP